MNAVEFVKKYGWNNAKYYLGTASNDAVMISFNMPEYGFERITLNAIDLKRIVESYELVESYGGVNEAKNYLPSLRFDSYDELKQAIENMENCQ